MRSASCRRSRRAILGGSPDDYDVSDGRVFQRGNPSQGLGFAQAAQRAVELGGRFDGHALPEDIHAMTVASATALAGLGLMGVAKDNYATGGRVQSYCIGFAEVEVDVETGASRSRTTAWRPTAAPS